MSLSFKIWKSLSIIRFSLFESIAISAILPERKAGPIFLKLKSLRETLSYVLKLDFLLFCENELMPIKRKSENKKPKNLLF